MAAQDSITLGWKDPAGVSPLQLSPAQASFLLSPPPRTVPQSSRPPWDPAVVTASQYIRKPACETCTRTIHCRGKVATQCRRLGQIAAVPPRLGDCPFLPLTLRSLRWPARWKCLSLIHNSTKENFRRGKCKEENRKSVKRLIWCVTFSLVRGADLLGVYMASGSHIQGCLWERMNFQDWDALMFSKHVSHYLTLSGASERSWGPPPDDNRRERGAPNACAGHSGMETRFIFQRGHLIWSLGTQRWCSPALPPASPSHLRHHQTSWSKKKSILAPRSEISLTDAKSHSKPTSSARCPDPGLGSRLRPGSAGPGRAAPIELISRLGDGRRPGSACPSSANCISSRDGRSRAVRRGAPGGRCEGSWGRPRRRGGSGRKRRERSEGEAWGRQPPGSGRAGRPGHLDATPGASASRWWDRCGAPEAGASSWGPSPSAWPPGGLCRVSVRLRPCLPRSLPRPFPPAPGRDVPAEPQRPASAGRCRAPADPRSALPVRNGEWLGRGRDVPRLGQTSLLSLTRSGEARPRPCCSEGAGEPSGTSAAAGGAPHAPTSRPLPGAPCPRCFSSDRGDKAWRGKQPG